MKLIAGQHFCLTENKTFAKITAGKVEVYAVMKSKMNFRKIFLMELNAGGAAFPSFDEFDEVQIEIYALIDSEISIVSENEIKAAEFTPLMRVWFKNLLTLNWLKNLADKGDDVLKTWLDGSFIDDENQDVKKLWKVLADNESIFSMLLGVKFQSANFEFVRRIQQRLNQKNLLLENTISLLLGQDTIPEDEGGSSNAKLEKVAFALRCVLKSLNMPNKSLKLAPETVNKLDTFGIMQRLAQKAGVGIRLITLEPDWYKGDSGIILVNYNNGQDKELGACLPQSDKKYRLVTYSNPNGIELTDEIAAGIENEGFICYATLPSDKLSLKDLLKFAFRKTWITDWRTIIIVSLAMGIIPLVTPIVTETIFSDIIPILDREGLSSVVQVAMVAGFTSATLNLVRSVALLRFSLHSDIALEAAVLGRLLTLPPKFFRKFSSGNLAARLQGLSKIQDLLSGEMLATLLNFIFGFWSLLLMCWYSIKLTGIALLIWTVYAIILFFIVVRLIRFKRKQTEAANNTAGILQQIFAGLTKFRVKGAEEYAYNLWGKNFGEEWNWNYAVRCQKNYMTVLSSMQPILLSLVLYYFTFEAISSQNSTLTYATFIAFQSAYSAFNTALVGIFPAIQEFAAVKPVLENLQPILDAETENISEKTEADILSGTIEVEELTFAYDENSPDVLKNLNFKINAGESVAIVGGSGSGKSTLLRLLLGFEKPKSGSIYYDGQDLSDLSITSVRSQMGVVLQGGQLMTGDIFRNIVGIGNLTLEDAWAAAKAAGIDEDIRAMPMQMQTMISEGSTNISGGQRQRILIARALANKPSIIIFDEATSALDNRTQAIVTESLDKLKATRIIVAHRLSTIRNVNRIFVMDGGRIAESGNFDELVAKGGIFASFVKRQII